MGMKITDLTGDVLLDIEVSIELIEYFIDCNEKSHSVNIIHLSDL